MLYTRAVLDGMVERGHGTILNLGSNAAIQPSPMNSSYAASKAALLRFTDSLAETLLDTGVLVFAISPGLVATDQTRHVPRLQTIPASMWSPIEAIGDLVMTLLTSDVSALSGRYFHVHDDLDQVIANKRTVLDQSLYLLGLRTL